MTVQIVVHSSWFASTHRARSREEEYDGHDNPDEHQPHHVHSAIAALSTWKRAEALVVCAVRLRAPDHVQETLHRTLVTADAFAGIKAAISHDRKDLRPPKRIVKQQSKLSIEARSQVGPANTEYDRVKEGSLLAYRLGSLVGEGLLCLPKLTVRPLNSFTMHAGKALRYRFLFLAVLGI